MPEWTNPRRLAAAHETSIKRRPMCGPRSFTRSNMFLLFLRLVTRMVVPKGSVRCAAVNAFESKISPLAVVFPWNSWPYQLATPIWYFSSAITAKGGSPIEVDDLASDLADSAINPATAQPIISLFIHPPISPRPLRAELAKSMCNWLRVGIAYFRQFGIGCQAKSSPCEELPLKSRLRGLTTTWLAGYFRLLSRNI